MRPNHAGSDIHGAIAVPLVRIRQRRPATPPATARTCRAPVRARSSIRALRVPRQCTPASEKPPLTRIAFSVVRRAAEVALTRAGGRRGLQRHGDHPHGASRARHDGHREEHEQGRDQGGQGLKARYGHRFRCARGG